MWGEGRGVCVAIEAGSISYLLPLWKRWAGNTAPEQIDILVSSDAERHLGTAHLPINIPLSPVSEANVERCFTGAQPPRWVLCGTSAIHHDIAAVRIAARRFGIPFVQFVDATYNFRVRFDLANLPDRILVIDDRSREDAIGEGLPQSLIEVVGHPAWESVNNLPKAETRSATFLSSPIRALLRDRFEFDEWSAWHLLREANEKAAYFDQLSFVPHPAHTQAELSHVEANMIEFNSAKAIEQSEVVFGIMAEPMTQAYLAGRRVICLRPNPQKKTPDLCTLTQRGLVPVVRKIGDLGDALEVKHNGPEPRFTASLAGSMARIEALLGSVT